jgi:hypothetical protein
VFERGGACILLAYTSIHNYRTREIYVAATDKDLQIDIRSLIIADCPCTVTMLYAFVRTKQGTMVHTETSFFSDVSIFASKE